jgi:hypothetical protein
MERIPMQYQRNMHVPPLHPARLAAATFRRAFYVPILTRPPVRAIRNCICGNIERIVKITLADYDKTMYEKGKLTGWF